MLPSLAVLCTGLMLAATEPLVLTDAVTELPLGRHLSILEDPEGTLTIEDVTTPDVARRFVPSQERDPRFAYSASAYWLHIPLVGGAVERAWLVELAYPLHDRVEFYTRGVNGFESRIAGDSLPFAERPYKHPHLVFPIRVPAHTHFPVWVRVKSSSAMILTMNLWRPEVFVDRDHDVRLGLGLYYGLFLAMALFNLLLIMTTRDRSHLWFVMFTLCLGVFDAGVNGLAFEHLWPANPWWAKTSIPVFMALSCVWATAFTRAYLHTHIHARPFHGLLVIIAGWSAFVALLALVVPYTMSIRAAVTTAIAAPMVSLLAAQMAWRNGYKPAGYFVVAISLLLGGIVLFVLMLLAVFPSNLATRYGLQIGSVGVLSLFSLGLGHRIKDAERERSRAQHAALDAQRLAREKVEALNQQLERRVEERTRELAEKNDALALLNTRKDELVATVSHDFRSPLAVIRQNVQTLLRDLGSMDHEDLRDLLQGVERQESRLTAMCSKLLDLARLKQKGLEHRTVDVVALTRGIVDGFTTRAQHAGILLGHDAPADLPTQVQGDGDRLGQVLQNLVDNALKFTPAGGRVDVKLDAHDGRLRICVEDTGCGIPPEAIPRLFEPFFQVPRSTHAGQGSGLGLAIVAEVVRAHGGTVTVESKEGVGTTFCVMLPLVAGAVVESTV